MPTFIRLAALLVLPLAGLLFLQWPLRDWLQAYSAQANDVGQIVFALYVAVAVVAASRHAGHLTAGVGAQDDPERPKPWRAWATLLCLGPWAGFMLWASAAPLKASALGLERFAETLTPGYFVIKLAFGLLLVLILIEAIISVWQATRSQA